MLDITAHDTAHLAGPTLEFVKREILRVGADHDEINSARAFVSNRAGYSVRAYEALPPRVRRLVDLLTVAGESSIEVPQTAPPEAA